MATDRGWMEDGWSYWYEYGAQNEKATELTPEDTTVAAVPGGGDGAFYFNDADNSHHIWLFFALAD